ncbi:MAG TPA: shikimate kinase [Propionicimonas sp.]
MSRPTLVLVGIPGSGKSEVGRIIAEALDVPFIEVDILVEIALGAPATEYFATAGEAAYREAEEQVAVAALSRDGVVALSSGAVTSAAVREALLGLRVVWLRTSVSAATRRLSMNSLGMAGLVAIRNSMDAMLAERARWYEMVSTGVVDTDRLTAEQVAAAVTGEQGAQ